MIWFKKTEKENDYKELLGLIVKLDAKVQMLDAEVANITDQIRKTSGRYFRMKAKADAEAEPEDSNSKNILVPV